MPSNVQIGVSPEHPCPYLSQQQERVAVILDPELHTVDYYEIFLANGFRRSGAQIYQPYCRHCQACQPIRINAQQLQLTKSQKRLWNKAHTIRAHLSDRLNENWFDLYQAYITARHQNGSMYPANRTTFLDFISSNWLKPHFLHLYQDEELIAIAVTDVLPNAMSALYTFYQPDHPLSLGTLAVLIQIQQCQLANKQWLYLGYQVDDCPAMNYKVRFQQHQRLVNQRWQG